MSASPPPPTPQHFVDANDAHCSRFVDRNLPQNLVHDGKRPWVTLTWAQSLDGRVASHPSHPRLMISGQESMQMTFRLRSRHDAILVSHATLIADDSQLSLRNLPEEQMVKQPIPIILDSNLQSPPSARLFRASRSPLIVYSQSSADPGLSERAHTLQKLGARLLAFDLHAYTFQAVFERVKRDFNINSILVEPGLTLIPAFLSQTHLVDMVVITTGSTIIGPAGRTPHWTEVQSTQPLLQHIDATLVGKDVVTILEPIKQA